MKLLDYMLIEWEKEREKREEEAISKKSNWRVSKKHTRALIWHEKVDELNQYLRLRLWENSIQKFLFWEEKAACDGMFFTIESSIMEKTLFESHWNIHTSKWIDCNHHFYIIMQKCINHKCFLESIIFPCWSTRRIAVI